MEWSRDDMLGFNVHIVLKKVLFFETNPVILFVCINPMYLSIFIANDWIRFGRLKKPKGNDTTFIIGFRHGITHPQLSLVVYYISSARAPLVMEDSILDTCMLGRAFLLFSMLNFILIMNCLDQLYYFQLKLINLWSFDWIFACFFNHALDYPTWTSSVEPTRIPFVTRHTTVLWIGLQTRPALQQQLTKSATCEFHIYIS